MPHVPSRFPYNDIISLTSQPVRYDLAESIGPDLGLDDLLADGLGDALTDVVLSYGPTEGHPELRELIAARHGVGADDVITTVGAMQALFLTAFVLSAPGAEVVIGRPAFPNARNVLASVGLRVLDLPLHFDDGYRLDVGRLRSLLTARTRLVSLASPQNPSGVALSDAELREVLAAMDEICPDAFLLVDETYREAVHGEAEPRASVVALDRRIISCASFSKCHGAPGIRTGWVITRDEALRAQLVLGKFNTTISNSVVDEAIARSILRNLDGIMGERRRHLAEGLAHRRLRCRPCPPARMDQAGCGRAVLHQAQARDVRGRGGGALSSRAGRSRDSRRSGIVVRRRGAGIPSRLWRARVARTRRGAAARLTGAEIGVRYGGRSAVIASEAKQSRAASATLDCFVASLLAMTVPQDDLSPSGGPLLSWIGHSPVSVIETAPLTSRICVTMAARIVSRGVHARSHPLRSASCRVA